MASNCAVEDFSFPATATDSPPRFIDSPPLWWISLNSPVSHIQNPENRKGKEVEDGDDKKSANFMTSSCKTRIINVQGRKSFSSHYDDRNYEDQVEKMDVLWEDLNEEFSRNIGKITKNSDVPLSPGRDVRVRCIKAIKLSRPNGHSLSPGNKPNILVFVKFLKKFFVLHNTSRRPIKKHMHGNSFR